MRTKKKIKELNDELDLLYNVNNAHKKLNKHLRKQNEYLADKNYKLIRIIKELESEIEILKGDSNE